MTGLVRDSERLPNNPAISIAMPARRRSWKRSRCDWRVPFHQRSIVAASKILAAVASHVGWTKLWRIFSS